MTEKYYFFNSGANDPRTYEASHFADYFGSVLSTGLLHTDNVPGMSVSVETGTLNTIVSAGKAIMKGRLYENTSDFTLTHAIPEPDMDRIDRIVLRLNLSNAERNIKLMVLSGTSSATPIAPALVRDNFIYDISLARILVNANTAQLLQSDLTDERLDENLAGLVSSLISVPTSQFQAEWDAWFDTNTPNYESEWRTFMGTLTGQSPVMSVNGIGADANGNVETGGEKAVEIAITDTGNLYTGTDVETALQEVGSNLNTHTSDNVKHITSSERTNWDGKANASHTHTATGISVTDVGAHYIGTDVESVLQEVGQDFATHNADDARHGVGGKVVDLTGISDGEGIAYDQSTDKFVPSKNISKPPIYGVKIDTTNSNPSTALTYTDGAIGFTPASGNNGTFSYGSWADKFPFNQIKPCLLKSDLTVNYYLNPNDYTKKLDGSAADITSGVDGDVMVEFPKLWWKFEKIGNDLHVRYADAQVDETWKCLAHKRGATEKDKVYLSAYMGNTISGKLRSLSGKTPTASQTIGTFRSQAQTNGAGFDQQAYFQLLMLQVLFIVMFKSRDSQTALGRGYVDGNTSSIATGGTNTRGLFYGETTGKQQNKFCGIEDFWGNVLYWIDGLYSDNSRNMLIGTNGFNDTGSGYTNYGQGATIDVNGYISEVHGGTESGFIGKAYVGSSSTHYADYGYLDVARLPAFGGFWSNADNAGAFYFRVNNATSNAYSFIGARLLAL